MTSRKEERKGLGEIGREGTKGRIISGFASEDRGRVLLLCTQPFPLRVFSGLKSDSLNYSAW